MNTMRIAAVLLALAMLGAAGCEDLEGEVRDTYQQYVAAYSNKDVATVLALTDPKYIEHLDYVVKKARTANREEAMRLTPAERVTLVRIRNRLTKKEIDALDGKGWLSKTVQEDWRIDEILDGLQLGMIKVRKPRAYGTMVLGPYETIFKMEFVKTGDQWVLDPMAIEEVINDFLRKQTSSPQREEQFIRERESLRSDKIVRASIWDPPK
jgi:hypothetical protein